MQHFLRDWSGLVCLHFEQTATDQVFKSSGKEAVGMGCVKGSEKINDASY